MFSPTKPGNATYNKPYLEPNGLTKQQYVDANVHQSLLDEGQAQFNAAVVRDEILQNGGAPFDLPGTGNYQSAYDLYKTGRLTKAETIDQMATMMQWETTSTATGVSYVTYYADGYAKRFDKIGVANGGIP